MRTFITPHILVRSLPKFVLQLIYKAADGRFWHLSVNHGTIWFQLSVDDCCGHAGIVGLEVADSFLKFIIQLPAHTCIGTTFRNETIKSVLLVVQIPFFDGSGGIIVKFSIRSENSFCRDFRVKSRLAGIVFIKTCDKRSNRSVPHQSDFLLFFLFHSVKPPFSQGYWKVWRLSCKVMWVEQKVCSWWF